MNRYAMHLLVVCATLVLPVVMASCSAPDIRIDETSPEERAHLEWMKQLHGDAALAADAAKIFASGRWSGDDRTTSTDSVLQPESMTVVEAPPDPRYPDRLDHRGYIVVRRTLKDNAKLTQFYDANWRLIAFLDANSELSAFRDGRLVAIGRRDLRQACVELFGVDPYFGMDSYRYQRSTILRELDNWSGETAQARGIETERQARNVVFADLDDRSTVGHLRGLQPEEFYANEKRKQEAERLARTGQLGRPEMEREVRSPYQPKDLAPLPDEAVPEEPE